MKIEQMPDKRTLESYLDGNHGEVKVVFDARKGRFHSVDGRPTIADLSSEALLEALYEEDPNINPEHYLNLLDEIERRDLDTRQSERREKLLGKLSNEETTGD
jgi:hypothetical protein